MRKGPVSSSPSSPDPSSSVPSSVPPRCRRRRRRPQLQLAHHQAHALHLEAVGQHHLLAHGGNLAGGGRGRRGLGYAHAGTEADGHVEAGAASQEQRGQGKQQGLAHAEVSSKGPGAAAGRRALHEESAERRSGHGPAVSSPSLWPLRALRTPSACRERAHPRRGPAVGGVRDVGGRVPGQTRGGGLRERDGAGCAHHAGGAGGPGGVSRAVPPLPLGAARGAGLSGAGRGGGGGRGAGDLRARLQGAAAAAPPAGLQPLAGDHRAAPRAVAQPRARARRRRRRSPSRTSRSRQCPRCPSRWAGSAAPPWCAASSRRCPRGPRSRPRGSSTWRES